MRGGSLRGAKRRRRTLETSASIPRSGQTGTTCRRGIPSQTHPRSEVEEVALRRRNCGPLGANGPHRTTIAPQRIVSLLSDPVRLQDGLIAVHALALEIVEHATATTDDLQKTSA